MPRISHKFRSAVLWSALLASILFVVTQTGVWIYLDLIKSTQVVKVKELKPALTKAAEQNLTLDINDQKITVSKAIISQWYESYTRDYSGKQDLRISERLGDYLVNLTAQTEKPAQDVRFVVADGKVDIVSSSKPGQRINIPEADLTISRALVANITEVALPTEETKPKINEDFISHLNITEKLATGQSNFSGSTIARIQNINTAVKLYNGLLIPAGEVFSFNQVLGDVDADHGYAPEKVIKSGKIAYEYGGGICQVSTTMFRAAIAAGFPIVERKNHAFPVHYYEPQGFDATIYPGISDMRFRNDSPSYVLVQTRVSGKNLYFDFYGTSDGRTVTVNGPFQYDIQPDGAMKAYLTRTINMPDGASKSQTFYSVYRSPALYPTEPNPYL